MAKRRAETSFTFLKCFLTDYFDSNNSFAIGKVFVSPATTFCSMTGKLSVSYHQMFLANGLRAKAVSVAEEKLPWL